MIIMPHDQHDDNHLVAGVSQADDFKIAVDSSAGDLGCQHCNILREVSRCVNQYVFRYNFVK